MIILMYVMQLLMLIIIYKQSSVTTYIDHTVMNLSNISFRFSQRIKNLSLNEI